MSWSELTAFVLLGLAGSGHCVGMCGGFALAIGEGAAGAPGLLARHAAYQAGKALTYASLAALLAAGLGVVGRAGWFSSAQTVLAVVAGAVMVLYGLMQAAEVRASGWWRRLAEPLPACRAIAAVIAARGVLPAFATGWLNGFLPCGLLLAVLFQAASQGAVLAAALGAAVFGAATFPGLFLFGWLASAWSMRWRRILVRVTGVLLVVFGVFTILRAFPEGRHWLHGVLPGVWMQVREWCGM
ncbi:MAG: sulfite exporter TauE/SafE family protein [Opitutaceae bacterium]|nr:sulfite exporter TauE/SafE family protein [Opitutaceae bacterium]